MDMQNFKENKINYNKSRLKFGQNKNREYKENTNLISPDYINLKELIKIRSNILESRRNNSLNNSKFDCSSKLDKYEDISNDMLNSTINNDYNVDMLRKSTPSLEIINTSLDSKLMHNEIPDPSIVKLTRSEEIKFKNVFLDGNFPVENLNSKNKCIVNELQESCTHILFEKKSNTCNDSSNNSKDIFSSSALSEISNGTTGQNSCDFNDFNQLTSVKLAKVKISPSKFFGIWNSIQDKVQNIVEENSS
ncbi:uncharacterized protein CMU_037210 [Cryptosporidium muris RN66]|uniref:Uncharacterized protein n=1 Tax=Cryptosporidium muris (strain RN66) TaxID=441375 RepID=B6AH56_CRYMR|nr:uncharacterized protein CMU_037210 [Cryptosporidium muris RN66]EEA07547.1 hypothetical protein CMU_037210 [Cryptosporidium muris RN66]|eukprot:XP_002141896.1 hypothetical protein [Cryptosporidium muris RN66]